MKCPKCGTLNDENAKFCVGCGSSLRPAGANNKVVYCTKCGQENSDTSFYCSKCGSKLPHSDKSSAPIKKSKQPYSKKQRVGNKKQQKSKSYRNLIFLVVAAAFTVFIVVRFTSKSNQSVNSNRPVNLNMPLNPNPIESKSNDPVMEQKVSQVTSSFFCSCGGCKEVPLETCTCQTAAAERKFIRSALGKGQTVNQVILAVNTTYGNMRPKKE
ncbi:MAG TPA: zinc ribbon domain-containing protein [Bacteroidetes bacterium]|nr:zinc ribbon domain-containing protein [Bacteroidota bacterium]